MQPKSERLEEIKSVLSERVGSKQFFRTLVPKAELIDGDYSLGGHIIIEMSDMVPFQSSSISKVVKQLDVIGAQILPVVEYEYHIAAFLSCPAAVYYLNNNLYEVAENEEYSLPDFAQLLEQLKFTDHNRHELEEYRDGFAV